jgi:structure-specific recognition protein 1
MSTNEDSQSKPKKDVFVRGLNWGDLKTTEEDLIFSHKSKLWFEMPVNTISNIQHISNKNEVALEVTQEEENADMNLCELRLFIPDKDFKNKKNKNSDENSSKAEENKESDAENEKSEKDEDSNNNNVINIGEKSRAELIKDEIVKKTKIGSVSNSIAHIQDIQMITPRGKFDLYFTKNYLKIHGISFNYQILNKNISKIFLLPKIDKHNHIFVLQLKVYVTQGNTQYPYLIFQIDSDEENTIELNLSEEDKAEIKDKLSTLDENNTLEGKSRDIVAQLFIALVGIGIIIPSKNFTFNTGPYIKCSYKVNEGTLYPLEKSLLFVHKPVLYILHKDIGKINFARLQENANQQRTFDIIVKTSKDSFKFSGIDKNEMTSLKSYFENKKIKITMIDENYNSVEMNAYTARRRTRVDDEDVPELPSEEESIGNEDYSDDDSYDENNDKDDNDDYDDDEEEENKQKKKKNENNKGKKNVTSKKKGNNSGSGKKPKKK